MIRLSTAAALCLLAIATAYSAPTEEIRVGSLGSRGVAFTEERPGTFDEAISGAGDVDGDGRADFLLLHRNTAADYESIVFLVRGRSGLPASLAAAELQTFATVIRRSLPRFLGSDHIKGTAPAGDVDADGFDDFFVLRPSGALPGTLWDGERIPGIVHLVHGSPSMPAEVQLETPPPGVRITLFTSTKPTTTGLGNATSIGDLNGDGKADIALAARSSYVDRSDFDDAPGRVYILFGGASFTGLIDVEETGLTRPGVIVEGVASMTGIGSQVVFPGDVNGDGSDDLLIGAQREASGSGRPSWAFLIFGGADWTRVLTLDDAIAGGRGVRFAGTGDAAFTGDALAAPGDWNGDGLADFVIGALGAASQAGEAYLGYGQRVFSADVRLDQLAATGLGVTFRGEAGSIFDGDFAGCALAVLDFQGDGKSDIALGAFGASYRGSEQIGRVYVIEGGPIAPAELPLTGVRDGSLPGALITAELLPTASELYQPRLGKTLAAVGDVDGDGLSDLLISAPSRTTASNDARAGIVHLVFGRDGARDPLRIERVEPDTAAVAGGAELTIIGAGLGADVEIRIGGAPAPVKRAVTSAQLVVEAPPIPRLGPADIVATRGGETATLAGGVRYVSSVLPDIDVLKLAGDGRGAAVRGLFTQLGDPLAFADLDQDGYTDIAGPLVSGSLVVIHGTSRSPGELLLPDLEGSERLEGVALIRGMPQYSECQAVGDINGDGSPELAVYHDTGAVTVLFGGGRLPDDVEIESLVVAGRGVRLLNGGPELRAVAGGGDLDGDGLGDLAVGVGDFFTPGSQGVHLVPGRRNWPQELFLDDSPRLGTTNTGDQFGVELAMPGDIDGDGRDDLLAGAPGVGGGSDGNAYVIFGDAAPWSAADTIQDVFARGQASRLDAFKAKDGLGYQVSGLGDFSGDGVPDLAVSAVGGGLRHQGECYVVFGGTHLRGKPGGVVLSMADLREHGLRILGEEPGDNAVWIAPAGDFNGDGLRDLLIGAPSSDKPEGKAYVVFGRSDHSPGRTVRLYDLGGDGVRISGQGVWQLGAVVQGGGDFNGDGRDDILVADWVRPGDVSSVYVVHGQASPRRFLRGDSNQDGKLQLSDAVHILGYLFLGNATPSCLDAADATDDGKLDLTDAVYVLAHLFLGGPLPVAPFPTVGSDPTADDLDCKETQ